MQDSADLGTNNSLIFKIQKISKKDKSFNRNISFKVIKKRLAWTEEV